jgi:serine/threonine-protein kinase
VSLVPDETGRFPLAAEATEMVGTPSYMAPEMLGRDAEDTPLSERTDVYLAGAVLYELLAGHPPHTGPGALAIISSIALSQPVLPEDAPPELAQICRRAMQADAADRFPSVEALQRAIAGYLEHRGSTRIAMRATGRLEELFAALEDVDAEPVRRREAIYRHFGICRFAFHEALAAWRDNADARDGLERATTAVARYELGIGDPHAALTLLRELAAPTEEAAALLADAHTAVAAQTAQQEALEQLRREHDPRTGSRRRWLFGGLFGLAFTVLPLADAAAPEQLGADSSLRQIAWAALMCGVVGVIGLWWRRFPTTTLNRRVFAIGGFLFFTQGLLALGAWNLGLPALQVKILMMLLWGVITGVTAITIDRWLLLGALGYLAGFLVAARHPAATLYLMSAASLVFALNVLWRWRPRPVP